DTGFVVFVLSSYLALKLSDLPLFMLLPVCWMAAILFSPLQQLTRRLVLVMIGVLALIALSEISKLDLHQYLKPATVSEIPSPIMYPGTLLFESQCKRMEQELFAEKDGFDAFHKQQLKKSYLGI